MSLQKTIFTLASLAICAGLVLSGCMFSKSNNREIAGHIASYTLPEGYNENFAVNASGYQLVGMEGPKATSHIYLAQSTKNEDISLDELQNQVQSQAGGQTGNNSRDYKIVETLTKTIKGQQVPVVVSEGVNSDGQSYRQINAFFDGRNGPALVSISSLTADWDWTLVDSFLTSIQ